MSFTWDATDVSTDLAQIRQRLGDTDSAAPFLTDEQIEQALADNDDSVLLAMVVCCNSILGIVARKIDRSGPRFGASRAQLFQHYKDLLVELRLEAGGVAVAGPSWSEHTTSDKETIEGDTDFIQPSFSIGRDDAS